MWWHHHVLIKGVKWKRCRGVEMVQRGAGVAVLLQMTKN